MKRTERFRRDESGMTYVFIGLSMMAFVSASMLAIDVGMLMTARNQAQNSADAGALAGVDGVEDELQAVRPSAEMAATASAAALILVFMNLPRLVQVICRDDSLTTCA